MQRSAPFLGSGLSELRNVIASPGDQLYQHLTDLIFALNEADNVQELIRSDKPNSGQSFDRSAHGRVGQSSQSSCAAFANMMDTSGPNKRKVRKKKRRRSATLPISSSVTGIANNSLSHPSATEFCVSHSPINGTSDSSFIGKDETTVDAKNTRTDVSDSDVEQKIQTSGTKTSAVCDQSCTHRNATSRTRYPNATMLSPLWMSAPLESDSFTETLTPARHHHQRRKRLIKRMAVDPPMCQMSIPTSSKGETISMDVDNTPRYLPNLSSVPVKENKTSAPGFGTNVELDTSCISSSDTDGNNSSDDGRQGDDELSDWCASYDFNGAAGTGDEYVGVPNLKQTMRFSCPKPMHIESSDTDMSQSSSSQPSRRFLSKSGASFWSAMNRRILQFLRDQSETELSLGELRKKEKKQALRLAVFYHLDVKREATLGCRYHVLCKTKYSRNVI